MSELFSYFSPAGRVFKLSDHAMYTDRVLSSQQSHDALKLAFGSRHNFLKGRWLELAVVVVVSG